MVSDGSSFRQTFEMLSTADQPLVGSVQTAQ